MQTCTYVRHTVGNGQVKPKSGNIEAVRAFPKPRLKKQVRAFLGLAGYYRKFLPGFSSVAALLTDLTRKNSPNHVLMTVTWLSRSWKTGFVERHSPNFTKPFVLQTDASERLIGAILSQTDNDNTDHLMALYSRKLLTREEKYSVVEKEYLAIKVAVEVFKVYLLGRHFLIQTDHRALEWLSCVRDKNGVSRYSLNNFDIVYCKGTANGNADGLLHTFDPEPDTIQPRRLCRRRRGGECQGVTNSLMLDIFR